MCKFFNLILTITLLSSCNFPLREKNMLPPDLTSIIVESPTPNNKFVQDINSLVSLNRLNSQSTVKFILNIKSVEKGEKTISINIATSIRQIELQYKIRFCILDLHHKVLVNSSPITIRRMITANSNDFLSRLSEAEQIYQSMEKEALIQLIEVLSSKKTVRKLLKGER